MHYTAFGLLHQKYFFEGVEMVSTTLWIVRQFSKKSLLYEFILKKEKSKGGLDRKEPFLIMTSRFLYRSLACQERILTKSQVH